MGETKNPLERPDPRRPTRDEIDDEIRFHIESRTRDLMAEEGLPEEAAGRVAREMFGDVAGVTDELERIGMRGRLMEALGHFATQAAQDLGFALRQFRKHPGFTSVTVLTLSLGIAGSTALFSVTHAVLLKPLPFPDPDRLVEVYETNPQVGRFSVSEPNYADWVERSRAFEAMGAITDRPMSLTGVEEPRRLESVQASASFFEVLGVEPLVGRFYTRDEDRPADPAAVTVLGESFWRTEFGADPEVLGRSLTLDGRPHTVVGVAPADVLPGWAEHFVPIGISAAEDRGDHWLQVFARLGADVSLEEAREEMERVARELSARYPASNAGWGAAVLPLRDSLVGTDARRSVVLLMGATALLLILACVNVSNLLLARATVRSREMGVRMALGAGRGRLIRQLLMESLVLAVLSGVLGVALASGVLPVLRGLEAVELLGMERAGLGIPVVSFALVLTGLVALVFGLAPALHSANGSPTEGFGTRAALRTGGRLRNLLAVSQVAIATILLAGAGLLGMSLLRLQASDIGFEEESLWRTQVQLWWENYTSSERIDYFDRALGTIRETPGVLAAAGTAVQPFSGFNLTNDITPVERADAYPDGMLQVRWRIVTEAYFETMGIPLLRGRDFGLGGPGAGEPVAIVNRALTDRLWPDEDPLGRQLLFGGTEGEPYRVIGVVADVNDVDVGADPEPLIYFPFRQIPWTQLSLMVRSDGGVTLLSQLRERLRDLDAGVVVPAFESASAPIRRQLARPRMVVAILGVFAAFAGVLSVLGVYGVLSFRVANRRREIGVRLALGAAPGRVHAEVVRDGARLVGLGAVAGLTLSYALARLVSGMLYGTEPLDPLAYGAVTMALGIVGLAATLVPARRATRVDPVVALHAE